MIKKAVQIGNPIVRSKSTNIPLSSISSRSVKNLIRDLVDSMKAHNLVGMAAPQIGKNLNVFVIQLSKTTTREKDSKHSMLRVFINPELSDFSKQETVLMEGCGSLASAQIFGPVKRPNSLVVSAYDENGGKFKLKVSGLMAKCVQHEFDHLRGIICIDKFTDTKKVMKRHEFKKKIAK